MKGLLLFFAAVFSIVASAESNLTFNDCDDALAKGKVFVQDGMNLRRKILTHAIRRGISANIDSSAEFRVLDRNWYLASVYLLNNKCGQQYDELHIEKNYLGAVLQVDLLTMIQKRYGSSSPALNCTGPVTLFNPAGCY